MTYDEGISWLQETLKGRQTLGQWKESILTNKYNMVSNKMTIEDFTVQRDKQMRTLYRQYLLEKSGTKPLVFTGGSTSISQIALILGNDILIDGTEISFIHELAEINGARGSFPDYKVKEVVENMVALHACLEKTTGTHILTIPLCRETSAMTNEMHLSKNVYDRESYEASLKDKPLGKSFLGKVLDKMKEMGRNPEEPLKLGEQQMLQMDEK